MATLVDQAMGDLERIEHRRTVPQRRGRHPRDELPDREQRRVSDHMPQAQEPSRMLLLRGRSG